MRTQFFFGNGHPSQCVVHCSRFVFDATFSALNRQPHLFFDLGRILAGCIFEEFAEVPHILKSKLKGDFLDGFVSIIKYAYRQLCQ
jgi:hypothetical protein